MEMDHKIRNIKFLEYFKWNFIFRPDYITEISVIRNFKTFLLQEQLWK